MSPTYTIKKEKMQQFVETIEDEYDVYGPVPRRTTHVFDKLDDPSLLDLDYDSTIMSPKKFFLPAEQNMLLFDNESGTVKDTIDRIEQMKPRLLLGIHSCDINGMLFLDRVFGGKYEDPYYQAYRENTTVIGLNCIEPCENGFCRSVNKNFVLEGYDLFLTEISDSHYYVHVGSPKGDRLLSLASEFFTRATPEDDAAFKQALKRKHESLPVDLHIDHIHESLDMAWDSPLWEELGEECMNCGSCALVCPTCYCFDVRDELDLSLQNGERKRKWDTCLYYDFALVAGNHNFREEPPVRNKYRIYHKMRGAIHEQGMIACIGCGRCISACPAGISIKDILNQLQNQWASSPTAMEG
ncbi:hypothetical protein EU537_09710 [Candidatus Thorarchaeota archaeon]|nr:MAG: hypothetical protein EU537_09710 [Candidatus Thorarchaeota archaeon]